MLEEEGRPVKVNGLAKVYDYLQTHAEYYEKLKAFIWSDISNKPAEMDVAESSVGL